LNRAKTAEARALLPVASTISSKMICHMVFAPPTRIALLWAI